jgi:uncharacterized protein (DUF305 family)
LQWFCGRFAAQWGIELRGLICPALAAGILVMGVAVAAAQSSAPTPRGESAMSESLKEPPPSPATRAYMDAAIQMHQDMAVPYSNDADKDFAATLEAQHKGAVAIATVELQYGKDPEMRRLAEAVMQSREREIALMQAWLSKHQ